MGILKTVLDFILDKDNQRFILFALLIGAIIFGVSQCDRKNEAQQEVQRQKDNIEALNDSVTTYRNEAGELTSEKLALQTDKEQLKDLNSELSAELEKEKGTVNQLTQTVAELRGQLGEVDSTSPGERVDTVGVDRNAVGQYKFTWEKSNSGEKWSKILEGYFIIEADSSVTPKVVENKITKDMLNMEIVTGVKTEGGKKKIFVRSTYPNLTFTDINGAVIDEPYSAKQDETSRWGIGLTGGYGYSNQSFAPFIGIGVTYDIISF